MSLAIEIKDINQYNSFEQLQFSINEDPDLEANKF